MPDLSLFFQQHASVEPFLKADKKLERAAGDKELYQSVADREKVSGEKAKLIAVCSFCVFAARRSL